MASAETIIRVSQPDAAWLNKLRDEYGFASVAVVVAQLRDAHGKDFEAYLSGALRKSQGHDRPA